jgi:hypothetical protein
MVKCMDCVYYKPIRNKEGFGTCFGVEIPGNMNPKDSPKCKGEYFKAR